MEIKTNLNQCLAHFSISELPEEYKGYPFMFNGIAKIKRTWGGVDYAICMSKQDKVVISRDFGRGSISEILAIYKCQEREISDYEKNLDVSKIKTITEAKIALKEMGYTKDLKGLKLPELLEIITKIKGETNGEEGKDKQA